MVKYANVIIDISHEKVDRTFQYRIPEDLAGQVTAGCRVFIPFGMGNSRRTGYVVEVTETPEFDVSKIKDISGVVTGSVTAESQLIELAWWMKERYGSTMNQALKTVLPVKQKIKAETAKTIRCLLEKEELKKALAEAERKHYKARVRLFQAFSENPVIPYDAAVSRLNLTMAALKPLEEKGMLALESKNIYRNPVQNLESDKQKAVLNKEQQKIADDFIQDYQAGIRQTYLLHGITGSGKTEVYMALIDQVLEAGKQVILLIPEIALTYQTVMRFYKRFGNQVSIINSRLSKGERYDQFERAKKGEVNIMIGPRSALFTPFANLGLIIIDEEHENAYKSEISPKYHAREAARFRAERSHASLVLGSATPSVESYYKALHGEYKLYTMTKRAKKDSVLAETAVVDLRKELAEGNKSMFSRILQEKIKDRLEKRQQIMLFINRRGYANFVSCRSCGEALKCPHCDVSLTLHTGGRMVCHYCGYQIPQPKICPSCGSKYIAAFGTGTQKVEAALKAAFPAVRTLRMDADTTSKKGGHEEILSAFAAGEADALIGTQMIVKGHDFANVTLVGIIAADLSLHASDYRCSEQTFELLTQAAGRAGRGQEKGDVIIQTYMPEHYCIQAAAAQDYLSFYHQEMAYRKILSYPPFSQMVQIQAASPREDLLCLAMDEISAWLKERRLEEEAQIIGPVNAGIYKLNDIYRKILYMKQENYDILIKIRNQIDSFSKTRAWADQVMLQYDFM